MTSTSKPGAIKIDKRRKSAEGRTVRLSARITPTAYAWLTKRTANVADAIEQMARENNMKIYNVYVQGWVVGTVNGETEQDACDNACEFFDATPAQVRLELVTKHNPVYGYQGDEQMAREESNK